MPKRTEMHYFFSRVVQSETIEPAPDLEDWLPVSFCLAKQTRCWYDNQPTLLVKPPQLVAQLYWGIAGGVAAGDALPFAAPAIALA
ncbi:hypothetical protein M0R45_033496 [Rubus argutus]|uniref:Uncharacterized protein n=1 Tax=Rubus argutus TaxID=59490 RepID=A0AAW1WMN1_RUBAR